MDHRDRDRVGSVVSRCSRCSQGSEACVASLLSIENPSVTSRNSARYNFRIVSVAEIYCGMDARVDSFVSCVKRRLSTVLVKLGCCWNCNKPRIRLKVTRALSKRTRPNTRHKMRLASFDRRRSGRTYGRTDLQTNPLIEMRRRI